MTIQEIKEFPVLFMDKEHGSSHESLLRAFQVLKKVKEMLERCDSPETILEVIEACYEK